MEGETFNIKFLGLCGNNKQHQSHNDGILEVFGIYSSFHMAQLQMGLSAPKSLGQANVVEVFLLQYSTIKKDNNLFIIDSIKS